MSRRGLIDGLESPHPLGRMLPGLYQDDVFAQQLTAALDEVLAPAISTLDNFGAYLDPWLAPVDFVEWLAGWVGVAVDENWPIERRRALVARAFELYEWRGTRRGLAAHIELFTGISPEITDNGAVASSPTPGAALPGHPDQRVVIRLRAPGADAVDAARLESIVRAAKPAHVAHHIEMVSA